MKNLKLLNKKNLSIFIFFILIFSNNLKAEEEPIDIWKLENNTEQNSDNIILDNDQNDEINIDLKNSEKNTSINIIDSNILEKEKVSIVGLYDPEENGLNINMWSNSNGNEIKLILQKLNRVDLSKDADQILNIALLTNSHFPKANITEEEFINFKTDYLIKKNDKNLINLYLIKNENNFFNSNLIRFYINSFLENADLENACKIFNDLKYFRDEYINKFKIYCLINESKREEAQLLFDLNNELGLKDDFYEDKFNFLMEYTQKASDEISDKNILYFHLSHRTNPNFNYQPNQNTPKFIWKYLSSSNLLEKIDTIDLEDKEKIALIEQATHEKNYEEKELFELYKRFQFNINQLLNVKESYKLLGNSEGRALLYQRLILTKDTEELLDLSYKLKESFIKDNIEFAFNETLKEILTTIDANAVPSNYSSFYNNNLVTEIFEEKKIKINNKIIHQSKLINYFKEDYSNKNLEKDLENILKKIKKDKKYVFSIKDVILLESLKSDGVEIPKKFQNIYDPIDPNIPYDIQILINKEEHGLALLRLVEVIGEDNIDDLGTETLHFIISVLNQLNFDKLRNRILLKVLPLKV